MLADLRYAFRQLARSPAFTAIALITLALGIGVNATTFSLMNVLMFRQLPYENADRIVRIYATTPEFTSGNLAPANYTDAKTQNTVFSSMAAFNGSSCNLAEPGQPADQANSSFVDAEFFGILGLKPILGRAFTKEDDTQEHRDVIVLSYGFWSRRFGRDPGVLGRTLRQDGKTVTIIGVMPPEANDPLLWGPIDLWRPNGMNEGTKSIRDNSWLESIALLRPGISIAQAQAELNTIAARLAQEYSKTNACLGYRVASFGGQRREGQTVLWMIMGLAQSVLLIACANLANLQLSRTAQRVREYAVRLALGASRLRLVRQLLTESLLLSFVGGLLGVLLALWGNELLGSRLIFGHDGTGLPLPIGRNVLLFSLAIATLTGVAFGLVPALKASRADINSSLKQGTINTAGASNHSFLRDGLVIVEIALSLVLLTSVVFFVRGFQRLNNLDLGCNPENLLTGSIVLPMDRYKAPECCVFYDRLLERLTALPGVEHASISQGLPFSGGDVRSIMIEGRPLAPGATPLAAQYFAGTPDFFPTMGMRVLSGRDFTAADRMSAPAVVIINENMARQLWPGENPVGKRISSADLTQPDLWEIVGVVNDTRPAASFSGPGTAFQFYRPLAQTAGNWVTVAIRNSVNPETLGRSFREAVRQIDPDEAVYQLTTVRNFIERNVGNFRVASGTLATFAVLGLLLSAIGIYGVTASLVVQRTREIGVRMALGAQLRDILILVLRKGIVLVAIGTVAGLAATWGFQRLLASLLPSSLADDTLLVTSMVVLLATSALLACYLPARRATQVDPVEALRTE
jgi:predicted permease